MSDMEYCKMLEMPVGTCDVVIKPIRKKRKNVVEEVIEKVNADCECEKTEKPKKRKPNALKNHARKKKSNVPQVVAVDEEQSVTVKKSGFDIISVQVIAIFALIVGIILTNIFWEDSGMNTLLKGVFGTSTNLGDASYSTFSATSPSKVDEVVLENGVMKFSSGSAYSPCDGIVTNVSEVDGVYTITVSHSETFTTVLSGLEYSYANVGDDVYKNIPVGYSSKEITVSMFDSDSILTSYLLDGENIVWLN